MLLRLRDVDVILAAIGGMRMEHGGRADEYEDDFVRRLREYRAELVADIEKYGGVPYSH